MVKAGYSVNLTNQNLINYANVQLSSALSGLVKRMDVANANIAEFESMVQTAYTAQSWNQYQAAYQALVNAKNTNDLDSLDALNEAYVTAYKALVAAEIDVSITWQDMYFSYSGDELAWNPKTHSYEKIRDGAWSETQNKIDVSNNSNVDISVGLEFIVAPEFESLSGSFYSDGVALDGNVVISQDENKKFNLVLDGSIPETTEDYTKGGTVTVTVSQSR